MKWRSGTEEGHELHHTLRGMQFAEQFREMLLPKLRDAARCLQSAGPDCLNSTCKWSVLQL